MHAGGGRLRLALILLLNHLLPHCWTQGLSLKMELIDLATLVGQ